MKQFIPIIIAIVLIVGVLAGINILRNTPSQQTKVSADVEFGVSLAPSVVTGIPRDSEFSVDLILHTAGRLVSAADIKLSYPDNLKLVDFKADKTGSGLETEVIQGVPDNFSNTLRYVGVNKAGSLPVRSTIRLGQLKFKAVNNGTAKVEITEATITIPGDDSSVEPNLDFGEYTIGQSSPSPSPSSSANPSSSPCPSPPICGPGLLVKAVIPQQIAGSPPQCTQYSCETPAPTCINGAIKGHRCVDNTDFVEWFKEWSGLAQTKNADYFPECRADNTRGDGEINIADFEVWRRESTGANKCQ